MFTETTFLAERENGIISFHFINFPKYSKENLQRSWNYVQLGIVFGYFDEFDRKNFMVWSLL